MNKEKAKKLLQNLDLMKLFNKKPPGKAGSKSEERRGIAGKPLIVPPAPVEDKSCIRMPSSERSRANSISSKGSRAAIHK